MQITSSSLSKMVLTGLCSLVITLGFASGSVLAAEVSEEDDESNEFRLGRLASDCLCGGD